MLDFFIYLFVYLYLSFQKSIKYMFEKEKKPILLVLSKVLKEAGTVF